MQACQNFRIDHASKSFCQQIVTLNNVVLNILPVNLTKQCSVKHFASKSYCINPMWLAC
jgi:hypothetical protein